MVRRWEPLVVSTMFGANSEGEPAPLVFVCPAEPQLYGVVCVRVLAESAPLRVFPWAEVSPGATAAGAEEEEDAPVVRYNALSELVGVSVIRPSVFHRGLYWIVYLVMNLYYALCDYNVLYLVGYVVFSFLGLFTNEFCFAYHLGDFIIRNATVKVRRSLVPL